MQADVPARLAAGVRMLALFVIVVVAKTVVDVALIRDVMDVALVRDVVDVALVTDAVDVALAVVFGLS